jgi:predicted DNA-binding transcriptional regulator AlpA
MHQQDRLSDRKAQSASKQMTPPDPEHALWPLPTVLAQVPLSRSSWLAGVKARRYPQPVRLSARRVAWRASDILALIASL